MKVLVTGVRGQLGYDVCHRLTELGIQNRGVDLEDFDIVDEASTREAIALYEPDCVIHCAAYTAVDKAEGDSETCMRVNRDGTENIAKACKKLDCKMVYISTDYVFEGGGTKPFEVTDTVNPQSVYGKSKLAGELVAKKWVDRLFIVRTSWVFGEHGHNFVRTMLRLGSEKEEIGVVNDQWGSPTYCFDLAHLLCDMAQTEKYGVYHATNEGFCSWYEFAREIMKQAGLACTVVPISSAEYKVPAQRPYNSRMSKDSLVENGFSRLPKWEDALKRYLKNA